MPELASFPYSEQAAVYTESGEQLGFAYFRGCASLRHECGVWSWGGRLSEPDFDLAAAKKTPELLIELGEGPPGSAVYITLDPEGRFIDVEGSGPPPGLEPGQA